MNKKGYAEDVLYVTIGLFAFILVTYLAYTMYSGFRESTNAIPEFQNPTTQEAFVKGEQAILNFDKLFVLAMVLLSIGVWIASYYVDSNPVFLPISLIIGAVIIMFSAQFANILEEVRSASGLATTVVKYPLITFVSDNLTIYITLMVIVSLIIIYGKLRTYSGG